MAKYWSRCVIKGLAEPWKGLSRNDPLYFAWGKIKAQQFISPVVKYPGSRRILIFYKLFQIALWSL